MTILLNVGEKVKMANWGRKKVAMIKYPQGLASP
jgi:hypothetical protein